jgi:hypothetical protein
VSARLRIHQLGVVALAGWLSACASTSSARTSYRMALVADTYSRAVERLSEHEKEWYRRGEINDLDHKAWDRRIVRLALAGKSVNAALRADADAHTLADRARVVVDLLDDLLSEQVIRLNPDRQHTARIIIESARSAILIYAAVGGD